MHIDVAAATVIAITSERSRRRKAICMCCCGRVVPGSVGTAVSHAAQPGFGAWRVRAPRRAAVRAHGSACEVRERRCAATFGVRPFALRWGLLSLHQLRPVRSPRLLAGTGRPPHRRQHIRPSCPVSGGRDALGGKQAQAAQASGRKTSCLAAANTSCCPSASSSPSSASRVAPIASSCLTAHAADCASGKVRKRCWARGDAQKLRSSHTF